MRKHVWSLITRENVLNAIDNFDYELPKHPPARNTFLLFNNKKYPAKHIRGMAFKVLYNQEISKNDYSGGSETVDFFTPLGFDVWYKGAVIKGTGII